MLVLDLRRMPTSRGELYYGGVPFQEDLESMRDNGVAVIWNLAAEYEPLLATESLYVPNVMFGNITDYDVPKDIGVFVEQLNTIVAMLKDEKKVFLHCASGRGRSSIALACIGVALDGKNAEAALRTTKKVVGGPETNEQCQFVRELMTDSNYLKV